MQIIEAQSGGRVELYRIERGDTLESLLATVPPAERPAFTDELRRLNGDPGQWFTTGRTLKLPAPPTSRPAAPTLARPLTETIALRADGTFASNATTQVSQIDMVEALADAADKKGGKELLFKSVDSPELLQLAGAKLERLGAQLRDTTSPGGYAGVRAQRRAAVLTLLGELSERAAQLANVSVQTALAATLAGAIRAEPDQALRTFYTERYLDLAEAKIVPADDALREALYPTRPPAPPDGNVYRLTLFAPRQEYFFENLVDFIGNKQLTSARELEIDDQRDTTGKVLVRFPATAQEFGIELTILPELEPELFAEITEPASSGFGYHFHSGHGRRVSDALSHGKVGSGAGKMALMFECSAINGYALIKKAYPQLQVIGTTAITQSKWSEVAIWQILLDLRPRSTTTAGPATSWMQIENNITQELQRRFSLNRDPELHPVADHYFFPHSRSALAAARDNDANAIPDVRQKLYRVVQKPAADSTGGFDPVRQPIPTEKLQGDALARAVGALQLTLRDEQVLARGIPAEWQKMAGSGFYEPTPGDLHAFRFDVGAPGTPVRVFQSTLFAHVPLDILRRMLAYEAGLRLGAELRLAADERAALALSFLERAYHQDLASAAARLSSEDGFLQSRYGVGALFYSSWARLLEATGNPDDFEPSHYSAILDRVRANPSIVAAADAPPKGVSEPLRVPPQTWIDRLNFDEAAFARLAKTLGVEGTVVHTWGLSNGWSAISSPNPWGIVSDANGALWDVRFQVADDGQVQVASKRATSAEERQDRAVEIDLFRIAQSTGREAWQLIASYHRSRATGQSPSASVAATVAAFLARERPAKFEKSARWLERGSMGGLDFSEFTKTLDPNEWTTLRKKIDSLVGAAP